MSAHARTHRIDETVILIQSKHFKKTISVPAMKEPAVRKQIEAFLEHLADETELIPAEELDVFRDLHRKYGKAGSIIRGYRARDGLTQAQLAKKIGEKQPNIAAIENGKRTVGKALAKKLAKVFRTDYRVFL